jgi:hypothetical protein
MKIIKKLNEFDSLNEGIFSSFFKGFGGTPGRRGKLESLLKDIKKAREEDVDSAISVEKEIWNMPKENSPEYRFAITNLNRQSRTYASLKGQEINSLIKDANNIIEDNPKLQAFFSSELAKIEKDTTEKLIKNIKPYKEKTYLDQLSAEFDKLVQDSNKKSSVYNEFGEGDDRVPKITVPEKVSNDVLTFLDMSPQEAALHCKNLNDKDIGNYYTQIKSFFYDLQYKYTSAIDSVRDSIKKAQKEGQDWMIPSFDKEEINIRYYMKKPMDRLRNRISTIEKEMKSRKHGSY